MRFTLMGIRHSRPQPERLAEKLRLLRARLGYTLDEMARALSGVKKSPPDKSHIHRFESGIREPSLLVLLEYSRVAGVSLESLIDDEIKLPERPASKRGGKQGNDPAGSRRVLTSKRTSPKGVTRYKTG